MVATATVTAFMVPRALDLAVSRLDVDVAKALLLLMAGVLLHLSWERAGAVGQAFFVGNLAWMTAVIGLLLRELPVRVCTSYLASDQLHAGTGLVLLAGAVGARWFVARLAMPVHDHALQR